ncbi:PTS sugar transporter subunit IIA (plasmid) [Pseudomonas silvicola]|nr:PTS sugar transporter subunit IIA [Pseudomonas silvicola]
MSGKANKTKPLEIAAKALEQSGYVKPGFINGMLAREKSVSTYIAAGIAFPHCAKENLDQVIKTGYQVFQFPNGGVGALVLWCLSLLLRQRANIHRY